jgi:hypothetical protein
MKRTDSNEGQDGEQACFKKTYQTMDGLMHKL